MNDNHNLDFGIDSTSHDTIALNNVPLRVAVIGGEILLDTTNNPSLTADAAEKTGAALIAASHELRSRTLARLRSRTSRATQR